MNFCILTMSVFTYQKCPMESTSIPRDSYPTTSEKMFTLQNFSNNSTYSIPYSMKIADPYKGYIVLVSCDMLADPIK